MGNRNPTRNTIRQVVQLAYSSLDYHTELVV